MGLQLDNMERIKLNKFMGYMDQINLLKIVERFAATSNFKKLYGQGFLVPWCS